MMHKLILRGCLSIATAMLLSTVALAQDAAPEDEVVYDPAVTFEVPDGWVEGDDIFIDYEGEPDPNGNGEVIDYEVKPAEDGETVVEPDDGTIVEVEDGVFTTTDFCIDCNVVMEDVPVRAHEGAPSEVQRTLDGVSEVAQAPASDSDPSTFAAFNAATAKCVASHSRSTWICEWQNGAGN